jgi:hypothetical protein
MQVAPGFEGEGMPKGRRRRHDMVMQESRAAAAAAAMQNDVQTILSPK